MGYVFHEWTFLQVYKQCPLNLNRDVPQLPFSVLTQAWQCRHSKETNKVKQQYDTSLHG